MRMFDTVVGRRLSRSANSPSGLLSLPTSEHQRPARSATGKVIVSQHRQAPGCRPISSLRVLLKDIYLGYFYGAKIGVIGLNGSGKSTLLRIMAGLEKEFLGEVAISPGYSVGFLEQEPRLDPSKTVLEVVKEGSADTVRLLAEFEAISDRFAEPIEPDEMDKLLARQGEVQEKLDALDAWDLDSRLELAMDALRCPPGSATGQGLAAFGVSFTLHLVASGHRPPAPYPPEALNTSPHRGTIGPGEKGNS